MKKTVTVKRILKLTHVEIASAIENASVVGWKLAVEKGSFKMQYLCLVPGPASKGIKTINS